MKWSVVALLVACLVVPTAFADDPARRPNVLLVLIDDMGYADLSCFGQKKIKTPNIDRLATEGIRFTQYYSSAPICSPSRTAILTGQYPARWRITSFLSNRQANENRGMAQWLDPKAPSLPRILKNAGYATGHFGKWHMGGQRDVAEAPLVAEYGFDKVITSFEGLGDRYLPLNDAFDGTPAKKYDLGSAKLGRGNITWLDRSTITSAWTKAAGEFIQQAARDNKPFYVNLWPDDVHSPFFPPTDLKGDGTKRARYLGVVQAMDQQVGVLFDLIRSDPKLRDNTIIILTSDNGPEAGAGSAGPFRGSKGNLHEGGIREPLIVWAPGLAKQAGLTDDSTVVAGMDLLPTVLALTATPRPAEVKPDGLDRSEAFLGVKQLPREQPIFWVRPPERPGPAADRFPDLAVRRGDLKLTCDFDGANAKLFDLSKDVGETLNLAADQPAAVESMKAELLKWFATLPPMKPTKTPTSAPQLDG